MTVAGTRVSHRVTPLGATHATLESLLRRSQASLAVHSARTLSLVSQAIIPAVRGVRARADSSPSRSILLIHACAKLTQSAPVESRAAATATLLGAMRSNVIRSTLGGPSFSLEVLTGSQCTT